MEQSTDQSTWKEYIVESSEDGRLELVGKREQEVAKLFCLWLLAKEKIEKFERAQEGKHILVKGPDRKAEFLAWSLNGKIILEAICVTQVCVFYIIDLTVNTGLNRPMFWKPLCLLSTPEGLDTINYQLTLIT